MQEVWLDSTGEIEEEHMLARGHASIRTPKHARDTTAEHVNQAHRIHVCNGRQVGTGDGKEFLRLRLKLTIAKRQWWKFFDGLVLVIVADHFNLLQQGDAITRIVLVCKRILSDFQDVVSVGLDMYRFAAPGRPHLKPGAVIGIFVFAVFVLKSHPDQELELALLRIIRIAYLL